MLEGGVQRNLIDYRCRMMDSAQTVAGCLEVQHSLGSAVGIATRLQVGQSRNRT